MNAQTSPAILIVEDERIVAKDLQQTLTEMGYDAFAIASSAEEAVACACTKCPDVVLMDIRIKGQEDGIQTAAILKRKFPVSVIYLTAHADEAMIDRAKRTEPDGYLLKPVQSVELRSMIEIALYKRQIDDVRDKLRSSEHRLYMIADNVPISIGYFDPQGRVQFANRAFREFAPSREEATGISANAFLGSSLHKESYAPRQRALSGERITFITQLEANGAIKKHEVTYFPDLNSAGTVVGVYALGYDVTEREQLAADLQQARMDLETILDNVPASITSWRVDLTNRFANRAAEAQFGISAGQASGKHMRQLIGEDLYRTAEPIVHAALSGHPTSHEQAERKPDDTLRFTRDDYVPEVKGTAVIGLYAVSTDITELRRSHDKIRELVQRLETVREEERRRVAIILHDGVAQDLFAMKLRLDRIEILAKRDAGIKKVCKELQIAIVRCMDDTRLLANDLRPVALAHFHVAAVIKEHARRFEEYSNLRINVIEAARFPKLEEATQLLFLRAAEEALTNVARHAHATIVDIALRAKDGRIMIEISDDGMGISESAINKPHSMGLLGLRERFAALGGGVTVLQKLPNGTTLIAYLPEPKGAIGGAA
ncbi:MAG TPA: PAS domain-containing protein [Steroidobacteraceae bacterium]|jgi:PAS domain S-box-containing protein